MSDCVDEVLRARSGVGLFVSTPLDSLMTYNRIVYALDREPSRLTRQLRGGLTITPDRVSIAGPRPLDLKLSDIRGLSFRRERGLFHIVLDAEPRLYFTPVLISVGGLLNVMLEARNTTVYTALWKLLSGPGRCARCMYDVRESAGRCPECGSDRVRPVA